MWFCNLSMINQLNVLFQLFILYWCPKISLLNRVWAIFDSFFLLRIGLWEKKREDTKYIKNKPPVSGAT